MEHVEIIIPIAADFPAQPNRDRQDKRGEVQLRARSAIWTKRSGRSRDREDGKQDQIGKQYTLPKTSRPRAIRPSECRRCGSAEL